MACEEVIRIKEGERGGRIFEMSNYISFNQAISLLQDGFWEKSNGGRIWESFHIPP